MSSSRESGEWPLVSIATPTLNQKDFIEVALRSVLGQGYPHLQYSVIDGGSTDGTLDLLRRYEKRLAVISEPGVGQSGAINMAWRNHEDAEIVAWLNSDDFYHDGAVERAVSFLRAHPEVDILYGDCNYVDAQGEPLGAYPTRPFDYLALVLQAVNFIPQPSTFIRRRVLERDGYLDEGLKYVMDFEFWLRVGLNHEIAYVPDRFAALRLHSTAKSIAALAGFGPELVRVYQRLFERADLPEAVRSIKREALQHAFSRAADASFWAGALPQARKYGAAALELAPLRPARGLMTILVLSLLGGFGSWLANRLFGNPYLKGAIPG